jgi:hypothetical protein
VRRRIVVAQDAILSARNDFAIMDCNRAYRDLARLSG